MKFFSTARLFLAVFLVVVVQAPAHAVNGEIPKADNLLEFARLPQNQGLPIVVFLSRDACPYCRTLRDSVLQPMFAAGKFKQRAALLEVSIDPHDSLIGFDGEPVTAKTFAERYGARITPTLLFLDANGHELSKRRIGISNLDLYVFYLNKSIDDSLLKLADDVE
jgi:thioredoxin-related protein